MISIYKPDVLFTVTELSLTEVQKVVKNACDKYSSPFWQAEWPTPDVSVQKRGTPGFSGCLEPQMAKTRERNYYCTDTVASAINMVVKSAEKECKGPVMKSEIWQPPAKGFTATQYSVQTRLLITSLNKINKFNSKKSSSVVIKKGKGYNSCRFKIGGKVIPSVSKVPVKCLGKEV